jgi:hypothetical protein
MAEQESGMNELELDELRDQLKDDPFGLELLDFETHPEMVLNGWQRLTREDRIDGASMRAVIQPLLAKALRDLQPPVLGSAFDKATITVEVRS